MSRIPTPATIDAAPAASQPLLEAVKKQLGLVPNMFRLVANHNGASTDPKADAAVRFAVKIVRERGHVSEEDLRAVRSAGYDDAQVIEIVLHAALNTWTNYINVVAGTDIDFPVVNARKAA